MNQRTATTWPLLYRRLSRLPNYIKVFGVFVGLCLDIRIERALPHHPGQIRPFRVPGCSGKVWLRDCVSDHAIFWQCLVQRQYDLARLPHTRQLMGRYTQLVAEGREPLIIDAGGNIGLSGIVFAESFPLARIVIIEPDTRNYEVLLKNVAPYGSRIKPILGAVWPRDQALTIINPDGGAAAFRVDAAGQEGAVTAYTIDALMRLGGAEEALLVKLDIEGGQKVLFSENTGWIGSTDALLLELDDWLFPWQGTSNAFMRAMAQHRFEYLLNGENLVCFNSRLAEGALKRGDTIDVCSLPESVQRGSCGDQLGGRPQGREAAQASTDSR